MRAKKIVLAVDDDKSWLDIMCHAVRQFGYEAVCVSNAKEALEVFGAVRPFLVLTDLRMENHIDGATMATRMHLQDPLCIFVVVSGLISTWDLGFLLGSVFTDALQKPVDISTLKRVTDYAWEKRQRWEQLL